jgi:polyisoprenoid-binding protein YceI
MALFGSLVIAVIVYVQWLDPGHKHDTISDLVTPTLSARNARIFEVAASESEVDFVTQVRGVSLNGVFPVESGTITLEPTGDQLRVLVRLNIDVDAVSTGNAAVDGVLRSRAAMATGDYPIAFYVATSRDLVPVTAEEITFWLDGTLEVHGVPHTHSMFIRAQEVGHDMWAVATSDLDLANHGIEFPAIFGTTVIQLTAHLQAYEILDRPVTETPPTQ